MRRHIGQAEAFLQNPSLLDPGAGPWCLQRHRKINFCCLNPSLGILLWEPELTNTIITKKKRGMPFTPSFIFVKNTKYISPCSLYFHILKWIIER